MFPSSSKVCEIVPFNDQTTTLKPLIFDEIDSSCPKVGEYSYLFEIPSPLFHYEEDVNTILQRHQDSTSPRQQPLTIGESTFFNLQEDLSCKEDINGAQTQDSKRAAGSCQTVKQIPRRKPAKKDRHSKINTAQGPRDRRMRVSLEVAKQFFALQDMLGFVKASRTIEWLLIQAKDDIDKLARRVTHLNGAKNGSCNAKCEFVSDANANRDLDQQKKTDSMEKSRTCCTKVKKKVMQPRKTAFKRIGKESRAKARQRARERTKEKMESRRLNGMISVCDDRKGKELNSRMTTYDAGKEEHGIHRHTKSPSFEEVPVEEPSSHRQVHASSITGDKVDNSEVIMGKWRPYSAHI